VNSLERSPLHARRAAFGLAALAGWLPVAAVAGPQAGSPPDLDRQVAALVAELGHDDYAVRESASAKLAALGPAAADALLAAAESGGDLEIALRARWLVDSLPLVEPTDPPEVIAVLEPFAKSGFDERVRIMHRLLRLDDEAGIEPLARIVRLERTPAGSRIAAALLVREWQTGDPYWPVIGPRILAGIGSSQRPAATLLRAVVTATLADSAEAAARGLDEVVAAAAAFGAAGAAAEPKAGGSGAAASSRTARIFARCLAELLARGGRKEQALEEAAKLIALAAAEPDADAQTAADLEWLATNGLPEAVDLLAARLEEDDVDPLVAYAGAVAWRARAEPARAAALAGRAARRLADRGDFSDRLRTALVLARWGADDWAEAEYQGLLDDRDSLRAPRALAAVLGAEFLHDRQRHGEAAAVLRRELEDGDGKPGDIDAALLQIERDPRSVRSRMLYFEACAAEATGDAVRQRQLLEASLRAHARDVDSLIAFYRLAAADPARRAEAATRVARALAAIEEEIQLLPDDANARNEYAWLVSNTEGNLNRAIEHSRKSLEQSFDSASYLDTLAHCHAAAGEFGRAVRTQWLAIRQEPRNQTLRRNLDRFREQLAAP